MKRRNELILLVGLLAALPLIYWWQTSSSSGSSADTPATGRVTLLKIENPSLHSEQLERIHKQEYEGTHRNIFSASAPPPPASAATQAGAAARPFVGPLPPPPPPPVDTQGVTFFGTVTDRRTGRRRAFFNKDEDIFIAAEGDTVMKRFRLVHIGNNTVELEEISSGRHATLTMEQPPTPRS